MPSSEHESSGERAKREDLGLDQQVAGREDDALRQSRAKAEMADYLAEQARAESTEIAEGLADESREPAGVRTAEEEALLENSRRQVADIRDSLTAKPGGTPPGPDEPYLRAREWGRPAEQTEDKADETSA